MTLTEIEEPRYLLSVCCTNLVSGEQEWHLACPAVSVPVTALFDHLEATRGVEVRYALRLPEMTLKEFQNDDGFRIH